MCAISQNACVFINIDFCPQLDTIYSRRVSNLKYKSMRFDFKAVVFVRANPSKKETTDGSGSHVNFIQKQCTFPEVVSPEKW